MRTMKASEARRRWFELLDEVVAGAEYVIYRNGHRILIRSVGPGELEQRPIPDYSDVLRGNVDDADKWGWEWSPEKGLEPRDLDQQ